MEVNMEKIAVMAVAAIAEEEGADAKTFRIISFREVQKSPLAQYLADRGIQYKKYELGD